MDRPAEIAAVGDAVLPVLEAKHRAREVMLSSARRAIQACAASIRATHRGDFDLARSRMGDAAAALREADEALVDHADVRYSGNLRDAQKEYAEACCTLALVHGDALPAPAEIGVEIPAYLNGLAEAASELRREALDCLRRGELERAETLLGAMDDVYALLVTIDFPDALTGGLRRTTDALRGVLERTRGDLTTALVAARLQHAIEAAQGGLGG